MRLSFCRQRGFPLILLLQGLLEGFLHHWRLGLFEPDPLRVAYWPRERWWAKPRCTNSSMDLLRGFGDGLLPEIPHCDPFFCPAELCIPGFYIDKIIRKGFASVSHLHAFTCPELLMRLQQLLQGKGIYCRVCGSGWTVLLKKWQPQKEIRLFCFCHWCRNCSCRSCLYWHSFQFCLPWSFSLFLLARKGKCGSAVSYNT